MSERKDLSSMCPECILTCTSKCPLEIRSPETHYNTTSSKVYLFVSRLPDELNVDWPDGNRWPPKAVHPAGTVLGKMLCCCPATLSHTPSSVCIKTWWCWKMSYFMESRCFAVSFAFSPSHHCRASQNRNSEQERRVVIQDAIGGPGTSEKTDYWAQSHPAW